MSMSVDSIGNEEEVKEEEEEKKLHNKWHDLFRIFLARNSNNVEQLEMKTYGPQINQKPSHIT